MFISPKPLVEPPDHECEYSKSFVDAYYDKLPRLCTICGKPEKSCKSCKFQPDDYDGKYPPEEPGLNCKYCKWSNRYYVTDYYQEKN